MDIKFEMIPSYEIAYLRQTGPYGAGNRQTMEDLKKWAGANRLLDDASVILGVPQDDPQTTAPKNCRYDACLVISGCTDLFDEHINRGEIAGGKYAVFTISHTSEALQKAWMEIFPELHRQGLQIDTARPVMERYAAEMVRNHQCEICVPIY